MTGHTLGERDLNRALLARQLLLERSALAIPRAVERVGGLQAQYAPSAYIGLWSRLRRFERAALTEALRQKTVVQATLMRATIHIVSRRDFWPLATAIGEPRRRWWMQATRRSDSGDVEEAAARVRELLAGGPIARKDIIGALGLDTETWNGVGMWLDLVRVPPSGTWERRRADLYGLAEHWLGPCDADPTQGVMLLARRYLRGFGPASVNDIQSFTGLPAQVLAPALERLRLRRFRNEAGEQLVDVPRGALPDADTPAPVRFLPTWDATLLVHARRTQVLPERYRPLVFSTRNPHSVATFLVDGQVAGTWRHDEGGITITPFDVVPRRFRRELDDEAEGLRALHA